MLKGEYVQLTWKYCGKMWINLCPWMNKWVGNKKDIFPYLYLSHFFLCYFFYNLPYSADIYVSVLSNSFWVIEGLAHFILFMSLFPVIHMVDTLYAELWCVRHCRNCITCISIFNLWMFKQELCKLRWMQRQCEWIILMNVNRWACKYS